MSSPTFKATLAISTPVITAKAVVETPDRKALSSKKIPWA